MGLLLKIKKFLFFNLTTFIYLFQAGMLFKRGMGNWKWENELENWKWEIISAVIIDEHDFCNVPRQNKRNIINWKIVYSTLQTVNFRKNNSFPFNNFPLHFPIFLFACSSFPYSLFPINYFPILISQSPVPVLITSFLAVQFRKEKLVSCIALDKVLV